MRIGNFFGRPAAASTPPATPDDVSVGASSRRTSIASIDMETLLIESKPPRASNPEYKNWILPFFVNDHTELAPLNRFHSKPDVFNKHQLDFDRPVSPEEISTRFHKRRRAKRVKPVKEILEQMNSSANANATIAPTNSTDELATIPYKFLFFHQDVRPAYEGTYTRAVSPHSARKIARNPSHRGLPNTNYDYDSEAEWQAPEEGDEDLMDDDEKSEDEDGEEMDDFLDDEGEVVKRQVIVGDMEPKCSGLCWEGEQPQPQDGFDLTTYRMDVLHDSTAFPIDPYSTIHWSDIGKPSPKKQSKPQSSTPMSTMQPPRLPLAAVDINSGSLAAGSAMLNFVSCKEQVENKRTNAKLKKDIQASSSKPVKMIPMDLLPAFKDAVSGSPLSKLGLIEVLKSQFPKCSKDAIKETLESIATRPSGKGIEKKWVLIN